MKLVAITLENFRCYKSPISLSLDDMTTIVGKNDSGKSTLLDALDVFFNDKALDKNDASKTGDSRRVSITCTFSDLPTEIILDENVPTNFSEEYLLNSDGNLEITKVYNCSLEKPKLSSLYVKAYHPIDKENKDLIALKINDLKARCEELGIDMKAVNKTIKRDLRQAIRKSTSTLSLSDVNILLTGDGVDEKGNAPKVWDGLKAALPLYALFKSDRQSSDQDAEAQDPLKIAIKEAISAKSSELDDVMEFVEQEVKKVADLTLKKIKEMDPSVAATLNPKFEKPNWATLIKASITGDEEIPLNKRGSGVRRLILLNFFRAKAERARFEKQAISTIYAIEEPETSQHPNNQRMLIRALQQLSIGDDQVIVTTHTPMLARIAPSTSLRFITTEDDGSRKIQIGGTEIVNKSIAHSLGVLSDHTIKMFIVVEGIHDITFLKSISHMFISQGIIVPDLDALELAGELIFVPAGGADNLAYWASKLDALDRPEYHIFDRDSLSTNPPKHQAKIDAVNLRKKCKAVATSRLEMENYVHYQAINNCANALGIQCNLTSSFNADDDVPKLLSAVLNASSPQHAKWGQNKVKAWLAESVVPTMTAAMVAELDPNAEMLGWMNDINTLLSSSVAASL